MVIAYMVTPDGSSGLTYTVIQAATFALGMLAMVGLAFVFSLIVVPYRQRNEARNKVEQQREPSDSEVNDAIRLLQTESLVTKHNNGEERSYSFAKVFLAIADQLSIGVSSIQFEGKIRKGLGIDEKGEWYFPYEDEGITHLIGVLDQNALVERRNEEYQHVTRELVSGATGIYLTPNAHLVKNTEVKYYLSSLGSRVVQQLRQQSVAHTEDSQSLGDGIQPIIIDKTLKIEVSKCYFAQQQLRPLERLTLIVELTVQVTTTPVEMASLQLCIGTDKIDPIEPVLPVTIVNSPSSYLARYNVSIHTLIERSDTREAGRILTFAMGQEWLSDEFQMPYDSPLLPQEVSS